MLRYIMCTAGGVAIGYFLAYGKLEKKYGQGYEAGFEEAKGFYKDSTEVLEKELRVAVDEVEALYKTQAAEAVAAIAETFRAPKTGISEQPESDTKTEVKVEAPSIVAPEQPKPPVNYNAISTKAKEPEPEKPKPEETEKAEVATSKAYLVGFEEFNENPFDYTTRSLTCFAGDQSVADEHDVKLEPEVVGSEIGYGNLAKLNDDVTEIWVRNDETKTLYEIVISHGTYETMVTGKTG